MKFRLPEARIQYFRQLLYDNNETNGNTNFAYRDSDETENWSDDNKILGKPITPTDIYEQKKTESQNPKTESQKMKGSQRQICGVHGLSMWFSGCVVLTDAFKLHFCSYKDVF